MPRVKRGTTHVARRNKLRKLAKGYKWGRKKTIKLGKTAVTKAGVQSYVGRKLKKRTNRALWNIKINAAVRAHGLSYSKFIKLLKDAKIELDRKVLAQLAAEYPKVFDSIVKAVTKK
ncbi:MAG: 50S ribosomal protein L20 [Candidatus Buchananbacteria bacterium RIFCSPHIGHO2_01_FULL_47_11b]|uniref:Large ribosomal subunit protein bL20 n=1 Tax=Candidatus Buchananbacteria bacterium RIFCSPHIGHO2_01_FULL_47_11b TaxID=1797537 RepID=A0A1G1Y3G4_9BACT|nr:MAG: 50S ribosomal protein L20 [Candidatus Buchananbacteria bacterium RIFCSPHIGHO2_01_FULL_47_11b]